MKKMLRDWLLTVGVRQNQKKHMLSKIFDGGFCFLHTLELVVREFMGNESVQPWMIKIKGLCRHLKMSLSGWTCFAELCALRHVKILKPPIGGDTRWGGHHQQVL
jgi:hypothetical protein